MYYHVQKDAKHTLLGGKKKKQDAEQYVYYCLCVYICTCKSLYCINILDSGSRYKELLITASSRERS